MNAAAPSTPYLFPLVAQIHHPEEEENYLDRLSQTSQKHTDSLGVLPLLQPVHPLHDPISVLLLQFHDKPSIIFK